MKVVVVGGGSTYTPELIEGFANRSRGFAVDDLVLLDIDRRAAGDRRRARPADARAGRLGRSAGHDDDPRCRPRRRRFRPPPDPRRRPGDPPDRRDAAAALRGDRPGDDRAGRLRQGAPDGARRPGDRRAAGRLAAPGAWIVDFTNPVGIVTQALLDGGHRAIGLCNVAIGLQRWLAGRFGVPPDRVELEHTGLNHLSWERAVRVDGGTSCPS